MSDTPLVDSCEQAYLRQTGDAINQDAIWELARELERKLAEREPTNELILSVAHVLDEWPASSNTDNPDFEDAMAELEKAFMEYGEPTNAETTQENLVAHQVASDPCIGGIGSASSTSSNSSAPVSAPDAHLREQIRDAQDRQSCGKGLPGDADTAHWTPPVPAPSKLPLSTSTRKELDELLGDLKFAFEEQGPLTERVRDMVRAAGLAIATLVVTVDNQALAAIELKQRVAELERGNAELKARMK